MGWRANNGYKTRQISEGSEKGVRTSCIRELTHPSTRLLPHQSTRSPEHHISVAPEREKIRVPDYQDISAPEHLKTRKTCKELSSEIQESLKAGSQHCVGIPCFRAPCHLEGKLKARERYRSSQRRQETAARIVYCCTSATAHQSVKASEPMNTSATVHQSATVPQYHSRRAPGH